MRYSPALSFLLVLAGTLSTVHPAAAQKPKCHVLCAPAFTLRPEWIRSHLFTQPRVQDLKSGAISRLSSRSNLDLLFLVGVPTRIPGLALYADASWLPSAQAGSNPFTDYSARQVGDTIRASREPGTRRIGCVRAAPWPQDGLAWPATSWLSAG